jgi:glutamate synthase domain-containing protein 1
MVKREQNGLYDATNEHDACGVGMVVNIHGNKSHELVDSALKVLENMRHRGAEGADNKTGDGAGIMLQIPHEFILLQGIPVPEKGKILMIDTEQGKIYYDGELKEQLASARPYRTFSISIGFRLCPKKSRRKRGESFPSTIEVNSLNFL